MRVSVVALVALVALLAVVSVSAVKIHTTAYESSDCTGSSQSATVDVPCLQSGDTFTTLTSCSGDQATYSQFSTSTCTGAVVGTPSTVTIGKCQTAGSSGGSLVSTCGASTIASSAFLIAALAALSNFLKL
jgi:hypothetical protein